MSTHTRFITINSSTGERYGVMSESRDTADAYTATLNAAMKPQYRHYVTATITWEA